MSCCARCGQGICSTAGKIALNKAWHKGCFCCYNCNKPLHVNSAKIYYGEVFCSCCCPEEVYPLKIPRVNSTPSVNPEVICSRSSEVDCCPRDVHSCSCIPACCGPRPGACTCCDEPCFKRIHCRPRSPKPLNYPPRQRRCCPCPKCRPCSPKKKACPPEVCPVYVAKKPCGPPSCNNKRMIYFQPCAERPSPCRYCSGERCKTERCRRCGEKVFAAEKVLTSHGAYHLGCFSCNCCCKSLCVKSMYEACGEIYCKQCYNNYFGISGYGYCC